MGYCTITHKSGEVEFLGGEDDWQRYRRDTGRTYAPPVGRKVTQADLDLIDDAGE